MSKIYKIGTRGSLLALTQCTLFKEELEQKSGLKFELEAITTQGDIQTDKPLWQLDGKDFFTKELDHALLSGSVDMVVHSYKDLGSDRPEGIELACISERKFANDIFLIKKSSIEKMHTINTFRVGTSSPRRIVNTEKNLKYFLPNANANLEVKCEMLRGNVNTRIQKLHDGEMDAIVLAHAGLERLSRKEDSAKILKDLFVGLDFMIMPQDHFPSSAAQGALAIETSLATSDELKEALNLMDDKRTRDEVKRERIAFNSYGGGCHLAVGINVKQLKNFYVHTHKGIHNEKSISLNKLEGQDYSELKGKTFFFPCKQAPYISKVINKTKVNSDSNLYITSKYCFDSIEKSKKYPSLWTAGSMTHKELTKKGFWVNGNANALGESIINDLCDSKAINLFINNNKKWTTLSHDKAQPAIGNLFASYSRKISNDSTQKVPDTDMVYWTSFYEYESLTKRYPTLLNRINACGLGKTYTLFKENNIEVIPFINHSHAKSILKEI